VFDGSLAYTNSKLANALYGNQLARRIKNDGVTVVIYDPGFIGNTSLLRSAGWFKPVLKVLIEASIAFTAYWYGVRNQNSTFERTVPFMARLAVDPEFTKETGDYYAIDLKTATSAVAQEVEKQEELVKFSIELLESKGFKV
jgi:NAD(P)-dependent dehydrogenase (short-subunit alcohol dehydrogenase family)